MDENPDHPHQAAVHLMKSLRCCRDCYEVSEADLLEIKELEYRKELLAQQLRSMNYKADSVFRLKDQIQQLQLLICDLRMENDQAQNVGITQITKMSSDRQKFENEQRVGILSELTAEKNLTHELSLQLESLLERIKYLNRINNDLIYNFCA